MHKGIKGHYVELCGLPTTQPDAAGPSAVAGSVTAPGGEGRDPGSELS